MRSLLRSSAALALTLTSAACTQQDSTTPPDPTATSAPQARNQPMIVEGCLRAGEAENTFVLTAPATAANPEAATYELVATTADLRSHVGDRVEVTGTLSAEQEARSGTTAVEDDKPRGTSGTPIVETTTKVELRRIEVASVRPVGGDCEP